MSIVVVDAPTLGEGWLRISRAILEHGALAPYDGQPTRELALLTLWSRSPRRTIRSSPSSAIRSGLPGCTTNFFVEKDVPELGERARATRCGSSTTAAPAATRSRGSSTGCAPIRSRRSATITTFQPLTDTTYIPCVSMLDFWLPDGALELVVYAHSLDFGKKAYGNLVELARLQEHVAGELGAAGRPARRARQVGARLRARVVADGRARAGAWHRVAVPGTAYGHGRCQAP